MVSAFDSRDCNTYSYSYKQITTTNENKFPIMIKHFFTGSFSDDNNNDSGDAWSWWVWIIIIVTIVSIVVAIVFLCWILVKNRNRNEEEKKAASAAKAVSVTAKTSSISEPKTTEGFKGTGNPTLDPTTIVYDETEKDKVAGDVWKDSSPPNMFAPGTGSNDINANDDNNIYGEGMPNNKNVALQ